MLASLALLLASIVPPQDSLRLKLSPVWEVGGIEDTAISFSRLGPNQIATDAKGLLYVVDADRFRVLVLDGNGRLMRTLGRQGGGPGELGLPLALGVSPSGVVSVYDAAKRGLVRFAPDGKPLQQLLLSEQGLVQQLYAENDSTYILSATQKDSARVVRIIGTRPTVLLSVALPERKPVNGEACGLLGHGHEPYFSPRLLWAAGPQLVVANADGSFSLQQLGSGTPVGRKATRASTSTALVKQYYGEAEKIFIGSSTKPCSLPIGDIVRAAGMAGTIPAYDRLVMLQSRVWAMRFRPRDADRVADLYDPRTGYLGSANVGAGIPVAMLPGTRLVSLERDADDVVSLRAYAVSGLP